MLVDSAALTKFCDSVMEHGFAGSKGGRGSRYESPHPFCMAVRAGEISTDAGDRVAVVFSRTPGVRKLRVLEAKQTLDGYQVSFSRPPERCGGCFQSGYGSFSLAVLKNLDGVAAEQFGFVEVKGDSEERHDYICRQGAGEEEEEEEDDEE